jgi:hypothetical protein
MLTFPTMNLAPDGIWDARRVNTFVNFSPPSSELPISGTMLATVKGVLWPLTAVTVICGAGSVLAV